MFQVVLWSGCTSQVVSTLHSVTLVRKHELGGVVVEFCVWPIVGRATFRFTVNLGCSCFIIQVSDCEVTATTEGPCELTDDVDAWMDIGETT